MPNNLEAALNPKSVAIVGASDNPHKVGGRPILYMGRYGYKGKIFPINPARAEVQGYKAYPDLASLPEGPDMAIVALAAAASVATGRAIPARRTSHSRRVATATARIPDKIALIRMLRPKSRSAARQARRAPRRATCRTPFAA